MASFTNDVELNVLDGGGVVSVPAANVQLLIGTATGGTVAQVVATRNPNTLKTVFLSGPLVEAGAMAVKAGALVLAMRATANNVAVLGTVVAASGNAGTSVMTVTGTPLDTAYWKVQVVKGGTVGSPGMTVQVSADAGRNYGSTFAVGAATPGTLPIPGTGITLSFATGTLAAGDTFTFKSTEPLANTAGVLACLAAVQASPYGASGWGSAHLLGQWMQTDAVTLQTAVDAMRQFKIYTRLILSSRDASPPVAYGGTAEAEATWMTSIMTDYAQLDAKRIDAAAGFYNMPGAFPVAGAIPAYRRPGSWAYAARVASGIPPQRHAGRVKDGSLGQIAVDATNDPNDGFVYHDERVNPGLDDARFTSFQSRVQKGGIYVKNPRLMAAAGSQFFLHPLGAVMDIACNVITQVAQNDINDDVRTTPSGTIDPRDALAIGSAINNALTAQMTNAKMISSSSVVVNQDWNVKATSKVKTAATIVSRGYILEEDIDVSLA